MKLSNRNFVFLALFIGIVVGIAACSKASDFAAVNTDADGIALHGFDAVAYFAVDSAVEAIGLTNMRGTEPSGSLPMRKTWKNLSRTPNPTHPNYGGYCSYAVSKGYTADADPQAWKIVEGKLFLNYSPEVKEIWEKNNPTISRKLQGIGKSSRQRNLSTRASFLRTEHSEGDGLETAPSPSFCRNTDKQCRDKETEELKR